MVTAVQQYPCSVKSRPTAFWSILYAVSRSFPVPVCTRTRELRGAIEHLIRHGFLALRKAKSTAVFRWVRLRIIVYDLNKLWPDKAMLLLKKDEIALEHSFFPKKENCCYATPVLVLLCLPSRASFTHDCGTCTGCDKEVQQKRLLYESSIPAPTNPHEIVRSCS